MCFAAFACLGHAHVRNVTIRSPRCPLVSAENRHFSTHQSTFWAQKSGLSRGLGTSTEVSTEIFIFREKGDSWTKKRTSRSSENLAKKGRHFGTQNGRPKTSKKRHKFSSKKCQKLTHFGKQNWHAFSAAGTKKLPHFRKDFKILAIRGLLALFYRIWAAVRSSCRLAQQLMQKLGLTRV